MHSARRGPDAWGVSDRAGPRKGLKRLTRSSLAGASGPIIMGHCRLATVLGTGADLTAVQPLGYDGMTVAHNGAVYNLTALPLTLRTPNDSEAWLAVMLGTAGNLKDRFSAAAEIIEHRGYYALSVYYEGELLLAARNMPLFTLRTDAGLYWSSVAPSACWSRIEGLMEN
jgi:predicted glutamine amidotransferase